MASVNKVIIVGNLGGDPEVRYFPNGDAYVSVSIATTDRWSDKQSGEKRERTDWHRVQFTGRLAEIVGEYLKKGSSVYIEGNLRTDEWQDKESGQKRYMTKVIARQMQMLGGRGENASGGGRGRGGGDDEFDQTPRAQSKPGAGNAPPSDEDFDDDIPF